MFSTKSNLILHQKKAKYCLKIRNDINNIFKCDGCDIKYCSKQSLEQHKENCILYVNMKHQEEITRLKSENTLTIDKLRLKHKNEMKHIKYSYKRQRIRLKNYKINWSI